MLYPKEDKGLKKLLYGCRNCGHTEPAENPRVYRNEILHSEEEKTVISQDIATDPTLPRANARCTNCGHREAVVFQAASSRTDQAISLYFVCVNCNHRWKE